MLFRSSFVDKIIFGKLNYNIKSSRFSNSKGFYEDCAGIVAEFCKNNGIECRIKNGARPGDDKKTDKIFVKSASVKHEKQLSLTFSNRGQ